ncbi:hypothetical protein D9M70_621250 [compost metagenome]
MVSGDRIGVAHLQSVTRIPGIVAAHALQCVACALVRVVEDGGRASADTMVDWQEVGAVAGVAVADRAVQRLLVLV